MSEVIAILIWGQPKNECTEAAATPAMSATAECYQEVNPGKQYRGIVTIITKLLCGISAWLRLLFVHNIAD